MQATIRRTYGCCESLPNAVLLGCSDLLLTLAGPLDPTPNACFDFAIMPQAQEISGRRGLRTVSLAEAKELHWGSLQGLSLVAGITSGGISRAGAQGENRYLKQKLILESRSASSQLIGNATRQQANHDNARHAAPPSRQVREPLECTMHHRPKLLTLEAMKIYTPCKSALRFWEQVLQKSTESPWRSCATVQSAGLTREK